MIFSTTYLILVALSSFFAPVENLDFRHHTNEELEAVLREFATSENELKKNLYSIGNSSGRPISGIQPSPLWVLELTAAPEGEIGIPNVKLVANIHGTETAGREILLHFIEHLIEGYGRDKNVTWLLDNTRIHVLPCLNPDGFAVARKFYCRGCTECLGLGVTDVDVVISGNFPDFFHPKEVLNHAIETRAVMKWMEDVKFVLSASLFGSFMVAIYPFCNKNETLRENHTPDDDVFQHLAKTYSNSHATMHKGHSCSGSNLHFNGGIVNGASWQNHDGDMTDYNYIFHGCMDVRLEISCCNYPTDDDLENLWNDNRNALMQYSMQANRGVTGEILDFITKRPLEASIQIIGRNKKFWSFKKTGEFWRILLPGDYELQVKADGYYTQRLNFTVKDYGGDFPKLTKLTILLMNSSMTTTTTTRETTTTERETTTSIDTTEVTVVNRDNQSTLVEGSMKDSACNHEESLIFVVGVLILKYIR